MGELETSAAISQITQLRARYSWAYDEADVDALAELFTPDAKVDLLDWGVWSTPEEIRAGYTEITAPHMTMHTVDTFVVEVDGDRASAKMYTNVFHPPREDDHPIRFVGRYFDTYERVGGHWLISSIRLEQYWFAGY